MTRPPLALVLALGVLAASALAAAAPPAACPGKETLGAPTFLFTGTFDTSVEGGYVMVPFDVAEGATTVRARLCHDQPELPTNAQIRHTLDLGIFDARDGEHHGAAGFRGWGGSSRRDVVIAPDRATNGFLPGAIPAGEWAAEIGAAAVAGRDEGDTDGLVNYRLEIYLSEEPVGPAWTPAAYDEASRGGPGWYKGDFHVHAEHSGSAAMREVFDYAFEDAGLDFITLSDYVTSRHWGEIGRFQADYPGKLIVRSAEIITYRGHVNNHGSLTYIDHRTGPVYELRDGALTPIRDARPASELFAAVHAGGGWAQVNHPTTFPSEVPGFGNICRGCSWSYGDEETDWSQVDAMEVQTGPAGTPDPKGNELGPNPFTPLAIRWWDELRAAGYRVTAVGSSDSHRAGRTDDFTQSPIGEATTVVYAESLSEQGIGDAIRAGHAYVKFFAPDGPDLRLEAVGSDGSPAIMGDHLDVDRARITARVIGGAPTQASPQPRTLIVLRDGIAIAAVPVTDADFTYAFDASGPGSFRLQIQRGSAIEALTNPISLSIPD